MKFVSMVILVLGNSIPVWAANSVEYNIIDTVRIVKIASKDYYNWNNAERDLTNQIISICSNQKQNLERSLLKCSAEGGPYDSFSCIGVCK